MSEKLSSNAEAQGDDGYESLASVEFAGEKQGKIQESEHATGEHLTLEEKVKRLRVPFEEDQEVKTLVLQRVDELQSEIAARLEELSSLEEAIHTKRAELESISDSFELRSGKFISRVRSRFGITDKIMENLKTRKLNIEQQIAGLKKRIEEIKSLNSATETTIKKLNSGPDYEVRPRLFTPGEKEELLDYEALSELNLDEYIALWRRLNPFYAAHVTRQGVRDHISDHHSGGLGEYSSGFFDILKQEKTIRPPAEARWGLREGFAEDDVLHCVELFFKDAVRSGSLYQPMNEESLEKQARNMFNILMGPQGRQSPGHRLASHFGRNTCLDDLYGAENKNEVFVIYPIDVLASQSCFMMPGGSFVEQPQTDERAHVDLYIWAERGCIPLDAGIVFLPKSTIVSPETGSTYELSLTTTESGEKILKPVIDEDGITAFANAVSSMASRYGSEQLDKMKWIDESDRKAILDKLLGEYDIPDRIITAINTKWYSFCNKVFQPDTQPTDKKQVRLAARKYLEEKGLHFKKVENGILAEDYWRQFFEQHPEEKPKHIVFYDGDPSSAVEDFLKKQHIANFGKGNGRKEKSIISGPGDTTKSDGRLLGFDSHQISSKDPRFKREIDRFLELAVPIAKRMIRAYFHDQEEQSK